MKIQWFGHACFRLQADGYSILIDPYADQSVPGLPPLDVTANAVLCSHEHRDHAAAEVVKMAKSEIPSPFSVVRIESDHDDAGGALRGKNTLFVLEADGVRVAHLGDLGHMLSATQRAAIGPVDALMLPIGGHYTIDAQTAKAVADALLPRVILPMHYRSDTFGYDVIGTLDAFTQQYTNVRHLDTNAIDITPDMPAQVTILRYP